MLAHYPSIQLNSSVEKMWLSSIIRQLNLARFKLVTMWSNLSISVTKWVSPVSQNSPLKTCSPEKMINRLGTPSSLLMNIKSTQTIPSLESVVTCVSVYGILGSQLFALRGKNWSQEWSCSTFIDSIWVGQLSSCSCYSSLHSFENLLFSFRNQSRSKEIEHEQTEVKANLTEVDEDIEEEFPAELYHLTEQELHAIRLCFDSLRGVAPIFSLSLSLLLYLLFATPQVLIDFCSFISPMVG